MIKKLTHEQTKYLNLLVQHISRMITKHNLRPTNVPSHLIIEKTMIDGILIRGTYVTDGFRNIVSHDHDSEMDVVNSWRTSYIAEPNQLKTS